MPELGVQGFVIEREALSELVARLAALTPAERAKVPGIKYARADLILAGAVVVESVLELGGFPALEVTEAGLREGVFFARHLNGDPPLFDDVRRSSVLNLAAQYHVDHAHTEHVSKLALGLFDDLAAAGLHPGDARERELLWAACVLHDIGMSVDYDDHHKHSRYLVLNSGLPGFDQREVAIIAQAVRFHRKGMPTGGGFEGLLERTIWRSLTAVRCCCDWQRTWSAAATSSCARSRSAARTARCGSSCRPRATCAWRAGRRAGRPSSSAERSRGT